MNRRGFFITLAALLFGTTARPGQQTTEDLIVYRGYRIPKSQCVITFSRDPRQVPMTRYVSYTPVPRTTT